MPTGLLLEGVVRRPLASLAVLVAGVLAIGGAAAGPLLTRATEQLALHEGVQGATVAARTVSVSSLPSSSQASALDIRVQAVTAAASPAGAGRFLDAARVSVFTTERVAVASPGTGLRAVVGWFGDDGCARLQVSAGRCPTGSTEVAISRRDATAAGLGIGDVLTPPASDGQTATPWRIVGIYERDAAQAGFAAVGDVASLPAGDATVTTDPLLVDQPAVQSQLATVPQQITVTRTLIPDRLALDDLAALRAAVGAVHTASTAAARGWVVGDPVTGLLDGVDEQRHVVAVTVPVVGIQLVLISWIGLAVLIRSMSAARAAEWTLGALRGLPRRQVVTSALGGTVAVLVVSAPVGLLLSAVVTRLLAGVVVGADATVEPWRPPVLVAVAVALAGSVVAAGAAAWRALRTPVSALLHKTAVGDGAGRLALAGEAAIAALAAVACYQVVAGGVLGTAGQTQLGLLAPALAAVAVGLVVVRAARVLLQRLTRRRPRRLGTLLSTRRLAYAPGVLRGAVVLIAGAALASSALNIAAVADRNRQIRAGQEIGAATVLNVATDPGVDLIDAVDRADPTGRNAMAVVQTGQGAAGAAIVAVDVSRYAAIATVDPHWSTLNPADIASALHPPTAPSIVLTGTQLRIDIGDVAVDAPARGANGTLAPPTAGQVTVATELSARVETATGRTDVDLGSVTAGTATLAAPVACAAGCRLLGLSLNAAEPGDGFVARFTVTGLATDTEPAATFAAALRGSSRWSTPVYLGANPDNAPTALATGSTDGLQIQATDLLGSSQAGPSVRVNDVPAVLPVLIGDTTSTVQIAALAGGFAGTGLDGEQTPMSAAGTSQALPRVGNDGVLVDLRTALLASDPASRAGLISQVWLSATAPASLRSALSAQGVRTTAVQTRAERAAALTALAPARAITLAAYTSGAGLVLAILVAAAGLLLSNRTRVYELASLRALGIAPGLLRRAVAVEIVGLLGVAILLGVATGVVTSGATVVNLPFYGQPGSGPPLNLTPAVPVAVILAVAAVLAAVVLASACATGLVRVAVPSRLRESLR